MKLDSTAYRLPAALLEHIHYMNTVEKPKFDPAMAPSVPIVIQSDFFTYTLRPGPVLKIEMTYNLSGKLLGVA